MTRGPGPWLRAGFLQVDRWRSRVLHCREPVRAYASCGRGWRLTASPPIGCEVKGELFRLVTGRLDLSWSRVRADPASLSTTRLPAGHLAINCFAPHALVAGTNRGGVPEQLALETSITVGPR